jgi:zinc-ribbon domain
MGVPMNCPRCNAEVADSATFCPGCGSAIRPTTTSFSYLPAGAPPWPTSTAQLPASVATLPRLSANGTAAAAQNGTVPAEIITSAKPERPRRSPLGILAVTGILVLAVLVGAGLTLGSLYANGQLAAQAPVKPVTLPKTTPTAATTPGASTSPTGTTSQLPTPSSFQDISKTGSSGLKVSLKYPSEWQEDAPQVSNGTTRIAFHPSQQIGINFVVVRLSPSDATGINSPNDINQIELSSLQSVQGVSNLQSITPVNSQRSIGGETWPEQDATFDVATNSGTVQFHATSIATQHSKIYYNIFFYSPSSVYNEALQKYFQPIFDSFQFTA